MLIAMVVCRGYNPQTGTPWPWDADNQCISSNANSNSVYTYTFDGAVSSLKGTFGINAKAISIRWQSADLITPTSPTPSQISTNTGPTSTTTPTNTSNPSASNDGLSTGAKAGIGVGVAVGAIMAMIIAFLVYRLRRTNKSPPSPSSEQGPMSAQGAMSEPNQMSVSERSYISRGNGVPVELDSQQGGHTGSSGLSEMDTSASVEMDARRQRL